MTSVCRPTDRTPKLLTSVRRQPDGSPMRIALYLRILWEVIKNRKFNFRYLYVGELDISQKIATICKLSLHFLIKAERN